MTVKVGQVWITSTGNCWLIEQMLDNERAMVRRIAISDATGELRGVPTETTYCWNVQSMIGRLLVSDMARLDGWIN